MDKALIVFLLFVSSLKNINAQSWQEVNMGQNSVFLSINPFDSSFWLKTSYPIHFDDGVFTHYTPAVVPLFNFVDFSWTYRKPVFSSSAMYSYNGGAPFFYKFDGNTFQTIDLPGEHQMNSIGNMVVRNDTLYMGTLDPFGTYTLVYFQDQLINTYPESHSNLLVGENASYSFYWGSVSHVDLPAGASPAIDNTMPSNHKILDAKLLPGTDTLFYTKIDHIGVGHGTFEIDSISTSNSLQMPDGHPRKLCFDLDGNLWVLFGNTDCFNSLHTPKYISKYNRSTQTWEQTTNLVDLLATYAGCANSTLNVELEVDPYNNIWLMFICDAVSRYFMFQQGVNPPWLGAPAIDPSFNVSCYPNPFEHNLLMQRTDDVPISTQLFTLDGKEIDSQKLEFGEEVLNYDVIPQGLYFLNWQTEFQTGTMMVRKN
jgi:hypothetical protein